MELHKDTSRAVRNGYTSPDQPGKLYTKNENYRPTREVYFHQIKEMLYTNNWSNCNEVVE